MMAPTSSYYNNWLRGLVEEPGPSYHILFDMAWATVYEYNIPNDDNRAEDGLQLRERFERESSLRLPDLGECKMLEFLIALAIRLNEAIYDYENPDQTSYWFWRLIENLKLDVANDNYSFSEIHSYIENIFMRLNQRLYTTSGYGGLFPLKRHTENQRELEVWYQMMAYLSENM